MTRYSRSVIPGRSHGDTANPSDIDRLVFGRKAPANDADDISDVEVSELVDRATTDRRKGQRRRKSDYVPLPEEKSRARGSSDSRRGPLLLAGAVVIVAVFGVVVWNAYRDGVRSEDTAVAPPIITPSGAFKSKPPTADADEPVEQASVFEQVEGPKAAVSSTPETRSDAVPAAPPPPAKVEAQPAAKTPTPAPVSAESVQRVAALAPVKTISPAVPAVTPAASAPAAAPPAPVKPAAPVLAGAYSPAFKAGAKYVVQIAAPSTEAAALSEWDRRAKASPELFSAAEKLVVKADVNGRTVYRLRAGAFATGADADAFCAAYQAKGGACFKTTR